MTISSHLFNNRKRIFKRVFQWQGVGVWLLMACNVLPPQESQPSSHMPLVEPSASRHPTPSQASAPSIPSASVSGGPLPPVIILTSPHEPISSVTPSPALPMPDMSFPTPSATSSSFLSEKNNRPDIVSVYGRVYDEKGHGLPGVTVSIYSNPKATLYGKTITEEKGYYRIYNIPNEISILIIASKTGYTTRQLMERTIISNAGLHDNRFDFGLGILTDEHTCFPCVYGNTPHNALSNKPEISSVKPDPDSLQNLANPPITLKFSEPMNTASVEKHFVIRAAESALLSVDSQTPGTETFQGPKDQQPGSLIWDASVFEATWNTAEDEVTFRFKKGFQLPADKNRPLKYFVTFSGPLQDKSGIEQDSPPFRLKEGKAALAGYSFSRAPDTQAPALVAMGYTPSRLVLTYSKPMMLPTLSRSIAGGLADRFAVPGSETQAPAEHPEQKGHATARNSARNYTLKITPGASSLSALTELSWFQLGGHAIYDAADTSTVLLALPQNTSGADVPHFVPLGAPAQMKATAAAIGADGEDNSLWKFGWKLVKPDGSLSAPFLSADLEMAQKPANAAELATALSAQLNEAAVTTQLNPPTSAQPWSVVVAQENKSLSLSFKDTSGNYVGWQLTGGTYTVATPDRLPDGSLASGSRTWAQGTPLSWFAPGDTLQVTIAPTVVDPAGNTMNPDQRTATVVVK